MYTTLEDYFVKADPDIVKHLLEKDWIGKDSNLYLNNIIDQII